MSRSLGAVLAAWPGIEEARVGPWVVRASGGFTGRANSARDAAGVALSQTAWLGGVRDWYAARDLEPRIVLADDRGIPHGWRDERGAVVLAGRLAGATAEDVEMAPRPDDAWLLDWLAWSGRGTRHHVLARAIAERVPATRAFARAPGGVALGVVVHGLLVLECVAVEPARRRQGIATMLCATLAAWAARSGAGEAALAVEEGNEGALALYGSLGLHRSGGYRYAVPA